MYHNNRILPASITCLASVDEMADNNPTERTALLGGDALEANQDNSTASRLKHFLTRNIASIILAFLLVLALILFPILYVRKKPSDTPSEVTELCTSAACVLASANILRSLSPR